MTITINGKRISQFSSKTTENFIDENEACFQAAESNIRCTAMESAFDQLFSFEADNLPAVIKTNNDTGEQKSSSIFTKIKDWLVKVLTAIKDFFVKIYNWIKAFLFGAGVKAKANSILLVLNKIPDDAIDWKDTTFVKGYSGFLTVNALINNCQKLDDLSKQNKEILKWCLNGLNTGDLVGNDIDAKKDKILDLMTKANSIQGSIVDVSDKMAGTEYLLFDKKGLTIPILIQAIEPVASPKDFCKKIGSGTLKYFNQMFEDQKDAKSVISAIDKATKIIMKKQFVDESKNDTAKYKDFLDGLKAVRTVINLSVRMRIQAINAALDMIYWRIGQYYTNKR